MKILCICLIMFASLLTACNKTKVDIKPNEPSVNSGDVAISDSFENNSLDKVLNAYINFESHSNEDERIKEFSIISLESYDNPFLFDGYKFYRYENEDIKEVPGYVVDRLDRTSIYVKDESPYILEVYNIFDEQSWIIYKYEQGEFIEIYNSGIYVVTEDADIDENSKIYNEDIGKDIDENINKYLNTSDYKTEYNLLNTYTTIDEAIEEYKK